MTATAIVGDSEHYNYDRLDRIVRRYERIFAFLVPVLAVLISLVVVGILIAAQGASPLRAYGALFQSAFGSRYALATSLKTATPLIMVGLGIALAARGGIINLGGEGQIIWGGIFASLVGIYLPIPWPPLHVAVCLLAAIAGGALWAFVPGYFFARRGVNIIVTTVLLNEIAIGILATLVNGPLKEPPGFYVQSALVAETAKLPIILSRTPLHAGFVLALGLAVATYVVNFRTTVGFEIRTIGENPVAALHAGIRVARVQILTMLLAGGMAGLAGGSEILGTQHRLRTGFLENYGYEALAVALLGQKHPLGVVLAALLFGALKTGRGGMVRVANLPVSLSLVLSGVIIFCVAVSPILMCLPRLIAMRELHSGQPHAPAERQKEVA
jgi:general nucleoside transport system permease protein